MHEHIENPVPCADGHRSIGEPDREHREQWRVSCESPMDRCGVALLCVADEEYVMGVYIKGMTMPKTGLYFVSVDNTNGRDKTVITVERMLRNRDVRQIVGSFELVPVPLHYDLIDHNALKIAVMNGDCETRVDFLKHTIDCINKAHVVIPSDMPTYKTEDDEA